MEQIKKVVSTKTTIKSISLFTNSFGFAQPMLKFTSPVNDKVNRQKFDTVFVPEIKILNKFTHSKGSIIDLQISPEIAFTGYVKKGDLLNHIGTKCKCGATYIVVGDSLFCSGAICPYKSTTNLIRFLIFTSAHILSDGDKLSSDDVTHYIRAFIGSD